MKGAFCVPTRTGGILLLTVGALSRYGESGQALLCH